MKSKLISILLCVLVLGATFFLIRSFPTEKIGSTHETEETETYAEEVPAPVSISRAYVIETAHDAEDLIARLAYGSEKNYETALDDIVLRLTKSSAYLKDELQDYYGASYFSKIADVFREINESPFLNSSAFSTRVSKMLTELENAYPADAAREISEDDPSAPMYYPKFDTDANGSIALAMLAIYRQQYQKNTGAILLTFGGNLMIGDTILGAEQEDSFRSQLSACKYPFPLYKLSSVLRTDSASFSNLESPLTDSTEISGATEAIKGLPSYAKLLKEGGLDVVSLSNDKILSYGNQGKADTLDALKEAGISYSEEGSISYYQTSLGTVAHLSYNIIDEIGRNVNLTYADAPKKDIAAARQAGAKFVVVHFNWVNTEKNPWDPCMSQVRTARAAVDNGANLVIGTHPEAIEAIEQYKGISIIYSPGNLSNRGGSNSPSFLFQQSFTLDANGNALPGQIQLFPLTSSGGTSSVPQLLLDDASVENFRLNLVSVSRTLRYGLGKTANFTAEHLNLIRITK